MNGPILARRRDESSKSIAVLLFAASNLIDERDPRSNVNQHREERFNCSGLRGADAHRGRTVRLSAQEADP